MRAQTNILYLLMKMSDRLTFGKEWIERKRLKVERLKDVERRKEYR